MVVTTVATALVAGLFYTWSCGIVLGLGKLNDKEYLQAMQSINRAIQQPVFLIVFMGALILLPASAWLSYDAQQTSTFNWLLAASLLYLTGVFGVTIAGNVPLNNMLDVIKLDESVPESLAQTREAFESKWNLLNRVRTLFAIVSLICAVVAIINLH